MLVVKSTSHATSWKVQHRSTGATNALELNDTRGSNDVDDAFWNDTAASSTHFTVGDSSATNSSGRTYVAYLFAHNNNDGGFGPDGDADVIKCGSYTGNGSTTGPVINLGFEPQWLMIKRASGSEDWMLFDAMRGVPTGGLGNDLRANSNGAENSSINFIDFNSTGFQPQATNAHVNTSGDTYIYMAIRRGPLAAPTDATKVFAPIAYTTTDGSWQDRILQSNFTTDLAINGYRNISDGGTHTFVDRLRGYGTILRSHQTNAESDRSGDYHPWPQTGQSVTSNEWSKYNAGNGLDYYNYQWKRAPSYFDVVAYSGTGSGNLQISHNLGAVPEMMWVKIRSGASNDWVVYHKDLPTSGNTKKSLFLNNTSAGGYGDYFANASSVHVAPTSSVFTLGGEAAVNGSSSYNYIAYLFATVAGVSFVGSYTGNATSQTIDCGFSNGARFVLIKNTTTNAVWTIFDSVRGINGSGTNDPYLMLNLTNAEINSYDLIDPHSSGFTIKGANTWTNTNNDTFIFYAIA